MKALRIFMACFCLSAAAACNQQQKPQIMETKAKNEVIETIMARRSIRKYKAEPVDRQTMQQILECGINAPNGMNKQSWEVRVVDNPEVMAEIKGYMTSANPDMDPAMVEGCFRDAPTMIFVANDPSYDCSPVDCGLLSQNIMLSAWSLGVGSVCLGSPVRFLLNSPEAMARLGFCFCIGSIAIYILTACVLEVLSWQYIFICCGIVNAISYVATVVAQRRFSSCLEQYEQVKQEVLQQKSKLTTEMVWKSGLVFFCVIMFVRNFLDSSIKNWMPTILVETYDAAPSFTLLLSVALLLTNIFGVTICNYIYNRTRHDELSTLRVLYLAIVPTVFLMLRLDRLHVYVLVVLFSCATVLVYGSGPILMINYPFRFHVWGIASTVGGNINSFAALGNVAASYGCGYLADNYGWKMLIGVWLVTVVVVVTITILLIPLWKKFRCKK